MEQAAVAIVGGGASGLAAAIAAARMGAGPVVVLEKQDRVGKKLLATGNGRCNLENRDADAAWHYHTADGKTLRRMLENIPSAEVLRFFEKGGLLWSEGAEGRVYPSGNQAAIVLDTLRLEALGRGVQELCGFAVESIRPAKGGWLLEGGGKSLLARRVVLACGGMAAPKLGGGEDGYRLVRQLGHTVTKLYPCLAALRCKADGLAALKGVRAVCGVRLLAKGKELASEIGEVQFTDYGLSGIPAMQLSSRLPAGGCEAEVDFFPSLDLSRLTAMLHQRRKSGLYPTLESLLTGLLHKKLAVYLLKTANIGALGNSLSRLRPADIDALADLLKGWRLPVTGTAGGWDGAQVTGGGVPLAEVEPDSFASRCAKGVYLTGELLDAVGDCGGFNLHWAFGSGIAAGRAAAQSLTKPGRV